MNSNVVNAVRLFKSIELERRKIERDNQRLERMVAALDPDELSEYFKSTEAIRIP